MQEAPFSSKLLTQDFYMHELYNEYMKNLNYYMLNSNRTALSVKFYHMDIIASTNKEDISSIHNVDKYSRSIYNIYEFCPIIDNQPLMYQVDQMEDKQGHGIHSMSTMTLYAMEEPLPDDIFTFYTNSEEIFRVVNVIYNQNAHNNMKLYQITYENAPITKKQIDKFNIKETYYYNNETNSWFNSEKFKNYSYLIKNKHLLINIIEKYYNDIKCKFEDVNIPEEKNNLINTILFYLIEITQTDLSPILNYDIKYDNMNEVLKIEYNDIFVDDPNYIPPEIPDDIEYYDYYAGKIKNELLEATYNLFSNYYPLIDEKYKFNQNI